MDLTTGQQGERRRRLGAVLLGIVAVATALVPSIGPASPAGAASVVASGATLTWKLSEHAWTSSSLSPAHEVEAPTTKEADGFRFAGGGGTFDHDTGQASIHFGGSFTLGNVQQGGYRIRFGGLHLVLAGDGTGELTADVAHCASAALCADPGLTTVEDVVVARLAGVTLTADGALRSATVTPVAEPVPEAPAPGLVQFPQALLDALPASLHGHFRQTGSGSDPNKVPAPLTFSFTVADPPTTTTSSTTPSTVASTSSTVATTSSTSTSTTAPPADGELQGGALDWGVKASFRAYVTGPIAHGSATPAGGATAHGDGTFRFPLTGGTYEEADDLAAAFGGSVTFSGHEGALALTLADPRVVVDGSTGTLVVDAESTSLGSSTPTTYDDVALATLDLSGVVAQEADGTVVLADVPAVLTADGAPAFSGFYEAGAALDPLTLTLELEDDGTPPGSSTSTTAPGASSTSTTAPGAGCLDRTSVPAGTLVPVCGAGFLAGEQVQVVLHSTPVTLSVVTAGADGSATASVTIPSGTEPGTHRLELRGVTSGRSLFTAPFTVTAPVGTTTTTRPPSGTLPRTGEDLYAAARVALLVLGVGLLLTGRSMTRAA